MGIHVRPLDELGRGDIAVAGGKGANLGELVRAGLPVPPGFVVTTAAYDRFVDATGIGTDIAGIATVPPDAPPDDVERAAARIRALFAAHEVPEPLATAITTAYGKLNGGPDVAVAVRSSATAEDLPEASFAGQQDTYLDVRGTGPLLAAVRDCWASLWTARAMAYRARQGIDPAAVSLAVVVQQMVAARSSGVMFTADPASGRRDRLVVSAAWGLGESVVGGSVSTDDHVVDKTTGTPLSRRIADKAVMTVAGAGTRERPVPAELRQEPVLDDPSVTELARLGTRIEDVFGAPQDIEWARDGDGRFVVVQSRPVTALPEPAADAPTTWPVPYPHGMYFRASIVEQMPDPLTPLFADLVDGSVVRSLEALMAQAFGGLVLREGDIGLPTINGYAYYYYRNSGMIRMLRKTPTAVRALFGHVPGPEGQEFRGGVVGWRERSHPRYVEQVRPWAARDVEDLPAAELLDGVTQLLDAGTVYYTAVQSIIPLAATSEILFRAFYDRFVRRSGDPAGHTFLIGFDSEPIRAERSLYDLAAAARHDPGLVAALTRPEPGPLLDALADGAAPAGVDPDAWRRWRALFRRHLDTYGHAVYDLDFADPTPAEQPGPLLNTIGFFLGADGIDPRERQRRIAAQRDEQTAAVRARLDPLRRALFDRLLRWAQDVGPVREDALADMGLAWPPMRRMLLELGRRLVRAGAIDEPSDVFWLRHRELRDALAAEPGTAPAGTRFAAAVEDRKMLWRGQRRATPPQLLPEAPWLMRLFAGFMPAGPERQTGPTVSGVAAGSGQVTARARVLGGPADFGSMQPGEVLVTRMTTPAWTPLFAMASAVVTDVGGPLSHSSIVAREYGIPAVLGTGAATGRIRTGQLLRVDGEAGTVTLLGDGVSGDSEGGDGTGPAPAVGARTNLRRAAVAGVLAGAAAVTVWGRHRRRAAQRG